MKNLFVFLVEKYFSNEIVNTKFKEKLELDFFNSFLIRFKGKDISNKFQKSYFNSSKFNIKELSEKFNIMPFEDIILPEKTIFNKLDFCFNILNANNKYNIEKYNLLYSEVAKLNRNNFAHGKIFIFGRININISEKEAIFLFSQWLDYFDSIVLDFIQIEI